MNLQRHSEKKFFDVCEIVRAQQGKTYNNAIKIPLSAVDKNSADIFRRRMKIILEPESFDSDKGFGIITPKENVDLEYLFFVLEETLPDFLARFQDGMNINPKIFKFYKIDFHTDLEAQKYVAATLKKLKAAYEMEEQMLERCKKIKGYYLENMFVQEEKREMKASGTKAKKPEQGMLFDFSDW